MTQRFILFALLALLLAACAAAPGTRKVYAPRDRPVTRPTESGTASAPSPYGYREETGFPRNAEEVSGPAVLTLLNQARSELGAGRSEQAVAALERALRIEPRNPFIWQQLAGTHLQRDLPEQAESVAQRSNSLARGNPYIEFENWRLIAAARQARGDTAGARQAQERMTELQDHLDD